MTNILATGIAVCSTLNKAEKAFRLKVRQIAGLYGFQKK
jgi:hypothetical protein